MKQKIIFFGTGKYVLSILEMLSSGFEIPLVLTTEKSDIEPVSNFCREKSIECLSVSKFDQNLQSLIINLKSPVGVLANFGLIIPKSVLDLFPKGIINVHPSLLPKYRGPTPGQSAILNGEEKTGVTIIKLDAEVDHGPILAQREEPIEPSDTSSTLYVRLFEKGSEMLPEVINKYLAGKLEPTPQNHSKATFTKTLSREDGYIDLNNKQSIINNKLQLMIRAYFPWPGVWTKAIINNKLSIIKFLPEEKVQVEGKKPVSYKDFANGYKKGREILQKLVLF